MFNGRLLIIVSLLGVAAVTTQGQTLLKAPGFEDANYFDVNDANEGWTTWVADDTHQSVSLVDFAYEGANSVELWSDLPDGAWAADLEQRIEYSSPTLVLRFQYTATTPTNYGSFGIDIWYFDSTYTQLEGEDGWDWLNPFPEKSGAPMDPNVWVEQTYELSVPPATAYVMLRFRVADGPITLNIDNVYFGPPPADEASCVSPADGGTAAKVDRDCNGPTLQWERALGLTGNQYLYFGSSFADVNDANTNDPELLDTLDQNATSYTLSSSDVEREQTYYWRVDQTVDGNVVKQDVWEFTVANLTWLDTFDYPNDTEIQAVWGANASVSATGYMRVDYNSTNYEVSANAADLLCSTDVSDNDLLVLELRGHNDMNDGVYVKLESNAGAQSGTVQYPDKRELNQQSYEPFRTWVIDLQQFVSQGVDLTNLSAVKIGVGNGSAPTGSGTVSFDNIRLDYPYCIAEMIPADFDNNCWVGYAELEMLANDWLSTSYDVTASAPSTGPILWYKFDDYSDPYTMDDSSGNNYYGILGVEGGGTARTPSNAWVEDNYDGGAGYSFKPSAINPNPDMGYGFVDIPIEVNNDHNTIGSESTVSFWMKDSGQTDDDSMILQFGNPDAAGVSLQVWEGGTGGFTYNAGWNSTEGYTDELTIGDPDSGYTNPEHPQDEWVHYAFVKKLSEGYLRIYRNGELVAEGDWAEASETPDLDNVDNFATLGAWRWSDGDGGFVDGQIDDFRIYDYALSHEEVLYLATQGGTASSPLTQGLLTATDATGDDTVNLSDLAVMAESWMQEVVFP